MVNDKNKVTNNKKGNVSLQQNTEQYKTPNTKASKKKNNNMKVNNNETEQTIIDPVQQFELELCWCIETLEATLANLDLKAKGDTKPSKAVVHLEKTIKTLKSKTQPVIAKRQVMRTVLGDYRSKMANDEKKFKMSLDNFGFDDKMSDTVVAVEKKGKFIKTKVIKNCELNVNKAGTSDVDNLLNKNENCGRIPDNTFRFNFNVCVDGDV